MRGAEMLWRVAPYLAMDPGKRKEPLMKMAVDSYRQRQVSRLELQFYAECQCRSDCVRKERSHGISIMPRFKAMVTAWVRSFVLSFERILLM